jgi:hypothetical protein
MKTILTLLFGLLCLSSFTEEAVNHEQIAFDYFVSEILERDFKHLSVIEFKGKTETAYSSLGDYKFCLRPEEKLQTLIKGVTSESLEISKDVKYSQIKNLTITNFKEDSQAAKLYVYHSVRVANNYYVFLAMQEANAPTSRYVIELNADGEISRNCSMK